MIRTRASRIRDALFGLFILLPVLFTALFEHDFKSPETVPMPRDVHQGMHLLPQQYKFSGPFWSVGINNQTESAVREVFVLRPFRVFCCEVPSYFELPGSYWYCMKAEWRNINVDGVI